VHRAEQDLSSGPGRTWQDLVDLAEYGRMRQIAVRLSSRGQSLLTASVETGGNR